MKYISVSPQKERELPLLSKLRVMIELIQNVCNGSILIKIQENGIFVIPVDFTLSPYAKLFKCYCITP